MNPHSRLELLTAILRDHADVVSERVLGPDAPRWAEERGWAEWLLALDESALRAFELDPARVAAADTPASLGELFARVRGVTAVPRAPAPAPARPMRGASPEKAAQIATLKELAARWDVDRVIDLGSGRGLLTRALAEELGVAALGVERRAPLVARASAEGGADVRFEQRDALHAPLEADPRTLVVGLHACGALGDRLIREAVRTGARVLHVGCCPQKISERRRAPLSDAGRRAGFWADREVLGLANASGVRTQGDGDEPMARRRRRYALWLLLRDAGVELALGDESRSISRRQFRHPLPRVVAHVFERRGLPAPSPRAIASADARARTEHGRIRRLSIPRMALSRVIELAIAFDRACALGADGRVLQIFEPSVSPRNLAVLR